MSTGEIYLLGAVAGFTIFLGLPVGRMRNVSTECCAFLNATPPGSSSFCSSRPDRQHRAGRALARGSHGRVRRHLG